MLKFLETVLIVALAVSFIWTVLYKWGVWEYLQVHADAWFEDFTQTESDLFNRMFSCTFCTCWWLSVLICIPSAVIAGDWHILLVPFCSVPLSKFIS